MGKLIIARHQESEWNKLGKWTGLRDRHLTDYGFQESTDMGALIKDIKIDHAFASMLVRTIETLAAMLEAAGQYKVPTEFSAALDERDYGDYTGKDKWEMEKIIGEEAFKNLRRGWDCPIPNGETLKMVYERVEPYFLQHILPFVNEGKNVLVVAHGNSLRALAKYIENISDEGIADVETPFRAVILYELDADGHMLKKELRELPPDDSAGHSLA
ncbi:MAG: 2,3-bisphosphoglycerate-dependent phosphoglycerate mutase [Minisyncoccia bacterium]